MKKLSTGEDSTLGTYKAHATLVFGSKSAAVEFLDKKIAESPQGEAGEVVADERQMIALLTLLSMKDEEKRFP